MRQILFIPFLLFTYTISAQQLMTIEDALVYVKQHHPTIRAAVLQQEQATALQTVAIEIPKTEFTLLKGQYNSANKNDNNITITQTFPFPTLWHAQHKMAKVNTLASEASARVQINEVTFNLLVLIQQQLFIKTQHQLLISQDSLFSSLVKAFELRYLAGEGTLLEKTAIVTQHHEVRNLLLQNEAELTGTTLQLQVFMQTEEPVLINASFEALSMEENIPFDISHSPTAIWQSRQTQMAADQHRVSKNKMLPDLSIGYFSQTLIGYQTINGQDQYFDSSNRFQGFTVGVSLPLWFPSHTASNKAARLNYEAAVQQELAQKQELQRNYQLALQEFNRAKANLEYYKTSALPSVRLLESQSLIAFKHGEVDYATFILNLQQVLRLKQNYLQALLAYNKSILTLNQLQGNL